MGRQGTNRLREEGLPIVWEAYDRDALQISKDYDISLRYVYKMLKKYCRENGKIYEDYLRRPHKKHQMSIMRRRRKTSVYAKKIPKTSYKAHLDEITSISELLKSSEIGGLIEAADKLTNLINKILEEKR